MRRPPRSLRSRCRASSRGAWALVVFSLALVASTVQAQTDLSSPGTAGAEAAVQTYTEAFATSDWVAAARVVDPGELEAMQDLMAFIADMDTTGEVGDLFSDEADGVAAFAQFMETVVGMQPEMRESLQAMQVQILGSVAEGDSVVHVVGRSRTEMFGAEVENVEVTTVRWIGDRWAVQLDAQLRGMTQAMKGMMEMWTDDDEDGGEVLFEEDWDDEDGG